MQWDGHSRDKVEGLSESSLSQEASLQTFLLSRTSRREGLHAVCRTELIPPVAGERPEPDDPEGPFLQGVSMILRVGRKTLK